MKISYLISHISYLLSSPCLAAGSATARDVALKGGMSLVDGSMITAIFTGMAAVISAIGTLLYCNRRAAKREEELKAKILNDPLHVQAQGPYVTVGECKQHRCALEKRIDEIGPALNRIFKKLSENDQRSEERAIAMHRRVDPLIEKLAATAAQVEVLKERK